MLRWTGLFVGSQQTGPRGLLILWGEADVAMRAGWGGRGRDEWLLQKTEVEGRALWPAGAFSAGGSGTKGGFGGGGGGELALQYGHELKGLTGRLCFFVPAGLLRGLGHSQLGRILDVLAAGLLLKRSEGGAAATTSPSPAL